MCLERAAGLAKYQQDGLEEYVCVFYLPENIDDAHRVEQVQYGCVCVAAPPVRVTYSTQCVEVLPTWNTSAVRLFDVQRM